MNTQTQFTLKKNRIESIPQLHPSKRNNLEFHGSVLQKKPSQVSNEDIARGSAPNTKHETRKNSEQINSSMKAYGSQKNLILAQNVNSEAEFNPYKDVISGHPDDALKMYTASPDHHLTRKKIPT